MSTHSQQHGVALTTITTLPELVFICGLDKGEVAQNMHSLYKTLFLMKRNLDHKPFISYTETPYEVSLVLDEVCVKLFPEGVLKRYAKPWRVIQFSLGASPSQTEGFISVITAPLGKAGISIFHISTFNTDYILVEDAKFDAAKACLKANFNIIWTDNASDDMHTSSINRSKSGSLEIKTSPSVEDLQTLSNLSTINQLRALPELSLYLTCITEDYIDQCTKELAELLFYPDSEMDFRFIAFTQAEDEVSLILDSKSLSKLPKEKLGVIIEDYPWIPIKRQKKEGLTETGVVSAISAPLANLSLLYLSSFQTGYVLVRQADYTDAIAKLEAKGFSVSVK